MDERQMKAITNLSHMLVRKVYEHSDTWFTSDKYKDSLISVTRPYLFACHQCMQHYYILETEQGRM